MSRDESSNLVPLGSAGLRISEASGLAYDSATRSLWTLTDNTQQLIRIGDLDGMPTVAETLEVQSSAPLDLEGIALSEDPNAFVVVEERTRQVLVVDRRDGRITQKRAQSVAGRPNAGLEGLTYDAESNTYFAVHEADPALVLQLDAGLELVASWEVKGLKDLSGVTMRRGDLWIVSDESRAVGRYERRKKGWKRTATYSLHRDSGEGIAFVGDRMYVIFDQRADDERHDLFWYLAP